jgi:hypothetical protein
VEKPLGTHWLLLVEQKKKEKKEIWIVERGRIANARLHSLTCCCVPVDWCPSRKKAMRATAMFFYEQCRKRERAIRKETRAKK